MTKEMIYKALDEIYGYESVEDMVQTAWMSPGMTERKAVKLVHAIIRNEYTGRCEHQRADFAC